MLRNIIMQHKNTYTYFLIIQLLFSRVSSMCVSYICSWNCTIGANSSRQNGHSLFTLACWAKHSGHNSWEHFNVTFPRIGSMHMAQSALSPCCLLSRIISLLSSWMMMFLLPLYRISSVPSFLYIVTGDCFLLGCILTVTAGKRFQFFIIMVVWKGVYVFVVWKNVFLVKL